ncbi:MAG: DUF4089 domain-containing protein [Gammaproteobacteria bacterium]|nr:DUF4089 domain-containing protein [Gammaproteobacteria bacterium]
MTEAQILAYVQAAAAALDLPMGTARAQRVATHLQRTAALAQPLMDLALPPELELAEIYQPKTPLTLDHKA